MRNYVKMLIDKLRLLKKSYWTLEPKYGLFYINKQEEKINLKKRPGKVTEIVLHTASKTYSYDNFYNWVQLKNGNIVEIRIQNFEIAPWTSILERTVAVSRRYFRYLGNGDFEELPIELGLAGSRGRAIIREML